MKVMKFGGGCLANANNFLGVADIVKAEKDKTIIVVSAILGVTDMLVRGITQSIQNEKNVTEIISAISDRHYVIAEEVIKNKNILEETWNDIINRLKKLERLLYGVAYTEEITSSLRALIVSYGERFCAHILAGVLKDKGVAARVMETDEIGMITDEFFEHATALLPEVKENFRNTVMPVVEEGVTPVITGYFGHTRSGKVTTFGRNGSDYSAAVVAFATGSSVLEIWKDVDGFMSADPKMVRGSHLIDRLSYNEAAELSYFGAKILHPRTVEPLEESGTPIHIKNANNISTIGTVILPDGWEKQDVIKSVTYNRNIAVIKVQGPGVGYKPGIIAEIGGTLSQAGINIYSIITSQTCINLLIDKQDSKKSFDYIRQITEGVIEKVDLEDNLALVAVVGEGLLKRKGVAARVFSAVARQNINVEMISSGASEVAYYFIVKQDDVEPAINAIHKEFFGNGTLRYATD